MKYNLKNRPTGYIDPKKACRHFDVWFEGFEKELREILKNGTTWKGQTKEYAHCTKNCPMIKEILGE